MISDELQQALGAAYIIERELGGGGMSRVFVADEAALGRRVVVKVLRPELAEELSAERFKREVKLAARLQHPHIVPLLTAGELDGGILYYTMPLVEGESLGARLGREAGLPVEDAVRIMRDVAGALSYAHQHGIVHRDIKPANILLSHGGAVVADFGIAKAIRAAWEDDRPADSERSTLTAAGTSIGTPAYMSPEQAAGDAVDHRADLYALGIVAYEMLAGRPPFERSTGHQLIAAHAMERPEAVSRRRAAVPVELDTLVMRLLEKHPADRPQSADELLRALDNISEVRRTASVTARPRKMPAVWLWRTVGAAATLLLALALWLARRSDSVPDESARRAILAALTAPADHELRPDNGFALSPDASRLAFVASDQEGATAIWVRQLDSAIAGKIEGTEGGSGPFWSPDAAKLGYFAGGRLMVIDLRAGTRRALCPAPRPNGATWTARGVIVFAPDFLAAPMTKVPAEGGPCVAVTALTAGDFERQVAPSALPDGRHVLMSTGRATSGNAAFILDIETGAIREVRRPGRDARLGSPHWMLFREQSGGPLFAQRFDLRTMRTVGDAHVLLDRVSSFRANPSFSVAERALVAYQPSRAGRTLVWVDRQSTIVDSIVAPMDAESFFGGVGASLSHDGRRIVFGGQGMWVYERDRRVTTRLRAEVLEGQGILDPAWAPGDSLIAYGTIFRGPITLRVFHIASGRSDSLFSSGQRNVRTPEWSPDGRSIVFQLSAGNTAPMDEIWIYSFAERHATRVWEPAGNLATPRWSPDGRWLAYVSDEAGAPAVYVRHSSGTGVPVRVSPGGGELPRWRHDGRELYYRTPNGAIMGVPITLGATPTLSRPRVAVADPPFGAAIRGIELTPDGRHFVAFARGDPPFLTLLLDWQARLPRN